MHRLVASSFDLGLIPRMIWKSDSGAGTFGAGLAAAIGGVLWATGAPFIRDLVVAGMMGEEVDPMSDPEAVTLITDLVTQCMAG